ncbi:MAG: ATP-binding cassette domain-containing protein [Prevotellaceae bacterium]|nr:ATP-binding cassette domain-containing protein [Prevotellaceae bacterium]
MEETLTNMIVDYSGVELRQDDRPVLSDVELHVSEGELIYIMGEVGSGKSSLLKSIYGELPIAEGEAHVLDTDMSRVRPRRLPGLRKRLGIIFQDFQLLRDRTVEQNLSFVLRATGWNKREERRRRIAEVLRQVGMEAHATSMPHELSGGEQQCVCIARALLNEPKLLIADEPTANLDAESSRHVMRLLCDIRATGTAIVLSTHNDYLPTLFPGRILRCQSGRLMEAAPAQEENNIEGNTENKE